MDWPGTGKHPHNTYDLWNCKVMFSHSTVWCLEFRTVNAVVAWIVWRISMVSFLIISWVNCWSTMLNVAAESDHESTDSDDEFYMCQICNTEEVTCFIPIRTSYFNLFLYFWWKCAWHFYLSCWPFYHHTRS